MSNFDLGDDPNAQAAVDKLIADYSDHVHIPWNIYEIAKYYREHAKYKKAINLYQRIVDNWPTADHALWSQLDMATSYTTIGNDPNAVAAIDKLVTRFSKNKHIAGVVYELAKSYRRSKKHEKANQICNLIIDKWPKSEHALWAQRDLARFNITVGDDLNAQAAVDKLLADFSKQGRIAQAVYDIAKQYHALQKYEKAALFYQYVLDNWPDDEYAMWAQAGLANLHIDLGDDAAVRVALDTLIADFNDHPGLPEAVFTLGERYYEQTSRLKKEERLLQIKEQFPKAIDIWERLITDLPPSPFTPEAYYFSADCFRGLGKHEKAIKYYQKVLDDWPDCRNAWSAQYLIGFSYKKLGKTGAISKSAATAAIKEAYEKVLQNYPDCPAANAARNWLEHNVKSSEGGKK
jgi:tetratricopeptide (TPR) repeat protein